MTNKIMQISNGLIQTAAAMEDVIGELVETGTLSPAAAKKDDDKKDKSAHTGDKVEKAQAKEDKQKAEGEKK